MCSRWRGSIPLNGSSSSSTCGSCTSAAATRVRCRMPLEYVPIRRSCASVISTSSIARPGGGRRVGQLVQLRAGQHELVRGEEAVHRLALADQAEPAVDVGVAPGRRAVDGDRAAGRGEEAGHHVQHRGLAGAVRAEQAGDPGAEASCVMSLTATTLPYQRETFCKLHGASSARPPSGSGPATAAMQAATRRDGLDGVDRAVTADVDAAVRRRGSSQVADAADQRSSGWPDRPAAGRSATAGWTARRPPAWSSGRPPRSPPAANARLPVSEATSSADRRRTPRGPQQAVAPARQQVAELVPDPAHAGLGGERRAQEHHQLRNAEQQPHRRDQRGTFAAT